MYVILRREKRHLSPGAHSSHAKAFITKTLLLLDTEEVFVFYPTPSAFKLSWIDTLRNEKIQLRMARAV
jgi:hypothetical protein